MVVFKLIILTAWALHCSLWASLCTSSVVAWADLVPPVLFERGTLVPLLLAAAAVKSLQSCPTLCDPIDRGPVSGILQERTLEWVAISFS